jgi:hypothetical protein
VLADSLAARHPGVELRVLALDALGPAFPSGDPRVVPVESLSGEPVRAILFGYEESEAAVALKPVWIEHLLARTQRPVLFLDADTWVTDSLEPLFAAARRAAWTLTPHRIAPARGEAAAPRELRLLCAGTFNGGVVGAGRGAATRQVAAWWRERVTERCDIDFARGLHHDQRWLDLIPGFLPGTAILRDPGINVAYWNLDERPLARPPGEGGVEGGGWTAGGAPLRLLHFSGFDPRLPERQTRHCDFGVAPDPLFAELARAYVERLRARGYEALADRPAPRERFSNGVPVPIAARRLYRELGEAAKRFGDPFDAARPASFFAYLRSPLPGDEAAARPISRLLDAVHRGRADLALAFPDPRGADRDGFLDWAAASGVRERAVEPELLGDD